MEKRVLVVMIAVTFVEKRAPQHRLSADRIAALAPLPVAERSKREEWHSPMIVRRLSPADPSTAPAPFRSGHPSAPGERRVSARQSLCLESFRLCKGASAAMRSATDQR